MKREDYWEEWLADRRAVAARIEGTVQAILAEGYSAIAESDPHREHVQRANRDRGAVS